MAGKSKDFDATELVKAAEDHSHQLKELADRVGLLEERVGNNENFAKSFAESIKSQIVASDAIAENLNSLISTDNTTRDSLKTFIRSQHIHNVLSFLKSFGGAIFWSAIGALITHFVPKIFGGN